MTDVVQRAAAGPLGPLLDIPGVTDVLVHGPSDVWIDRGGGLERTAVRFSGPAEVREVAVRLAVAGGRRLDDAQPVVDARLPDGTRLHAILPPVADACAAIALRTVRARAMTLGDLELAGTLAPSLSAVLAGLVHARASILITGATGSGKSTLLASLLSLVDRGERIVLIEEAGEVAPEHPHVVRLVERRANVDGAGAVGLDRLVREALRMRPDRIVLGECRGAEVREVLLALNTGHRGGMTTLHANAPGEVPARLAALGSLAGMDARSVALHAAAAFDVVVHLERVDGVRRVVEVAALEARESRGGLRLRVDVAARWGGAAGIEPGAAWGEIAALAGLPVERRATEHAVAVTQGFARDTTREPAADAVAA